jgi:uncharacterized protein
MSIKAFTAESQHYVYSSWTNQIARIGGRLYNLLADDAPPQQRRRIAQDLGLWPDQAATLEVFPDEMISSGLAELQRVGPAHLVLTVTEACNFRCRYCTYSGDYAYARRHSNTHMSEETAISAVRWYLRFPRQTYSIGFYGGEPLLRRAVIERIIRAARGSLPAGAELGLSMTSNGWLLDDKSVRFLVDNDIDLFVSLDGPASVHDRYRLTSKGKPTFDRVWTRIERIRRQYPQYFERHLNFSITFAPPDKTGEIDAFVQNNRETFANKVPKIGLLNGAPSGVMQRLGIAVGTEHVDFSSLRTRYIGTMIGGGEPDGLSRACGEASMARIHNRPMATVATLQTAAGQCMPGKRCHVTPNGQLHMCEHGDEQRPIGHIDTGFDQTRVRALIEDFRAFVQPRCQGCWAVRLCTKCIPQLAMGTCLSAERFAAQCVSIQTGLERDLADYCGARSRNERCFDSLASGPDESNTPLQ